MGRVPWRFPLRNTDGFPRICFPFFFGIDVLIITIKQVRKLFCWIYLGWNVTYYIIFNIVEAVNNRGQVLMKYLLRIYINKKNNSRLN